MEVEREDSVLEQFRRQWREEVSARAVHEKKRKAEDHNTLQTGDGYGSDASVPSIPPRRHPPAFGNCHERAVDQSQGGKWSELTHGVDRMTLGSADEDGFASGTSKEPESALEHYERAVEKENQGNLGTSVSHYRKAYRLDASVDQSYKHKHFPPTSKPSNPNPSNAPATVPSTAHHSSKSCDEAVPILELARSFARLPILGGLPAIPGDKSPPCPMRFLPSEILFKILLETAIFDPALFSRLALVCKRLAFYSFAESQIWKRIALGPEFGLASNVYDFKTDLHGRDIIDKPLASFGEGPGRHETFSNGQSKQDLQDWREVFRKYPRIRFTGVYISTVNYTRAGGASASRASWGSPVHIVTYYRYLRFFRDGTVISLLSTNEPAEIVRQLTKENVSLAAGGKEHHPLNFTASAPATNSPHVLGPNATAHQLMKHALRGRWRLGPSVVAGQPSTAGLIADPWDTAGEVFIETEGAGPKYLYTMHLAMTSSSKSKHTVKNNKLQWKGFWSYNQMTKDWVPFQLKNDKPFFFSRVSSYGLGY